MVRVGAASIFPKAFPLWVAFRERLRELGYIEGRNIAFEFLELPDHRAVAEAMRELVRRNVDIIVDAGEEVTLQAAMAATTSIPIVMLAVTYDPVLQGAFRDRVPMSLASTFAGQSLFRNIWHF